MTGIPGFAEQTVRKTAATMVALMRGLGHDRFASSGTTAAPWSPSGPRSTTPTRSSTSACST